MLPLDNAAQQAAIAAADAAKAKELAQRNLEMMAICVECGKPADKICEQCGDVYCSITWMGNPGCFPKYHSKGNRIKHTWKPYTPATADSEVDDKKKHHHHHHHHHKKKDAKKEHTKEHTKEHKGKKKGGDEKAKKKDGDKRRKALK
jgi:hypothetical protein